MAIFRNSKYNVSVPAMYEDPIPTSDKLFFQKDAYRSSDLNHYMDKTITFNTAGNGFTDFGSSNTLQASLLGGMLMLTGPTVFVRHYQSNTNNVANNNLDISNFVSMDPQNTHRPVMYFSNGNNDCVLSTFRWSDGTTWRTWFNRFVDVKPNDLTNATPVQTTYYGEDYSVFPVYLNATTNNVVSVCYNHTSDYAVRSEQASRLTGAFSASTPTLSRIGDTNGRTSQFVGVSTTSDYGVFMHNNVNDDYTQIFYVYNDSANTIVTANTFSTAPSAAGSSAGGVRTQGGALPKFASSTFEDPSNASIKGFYVPYLDSTNSYHPFYYQWNTTNNVFVRNSDITVTYPSGNTFSSYWAADTVSGSSVNTNYGLQRCWYNETFVFSGTRYLTFMQLHGAGGVYDSESLRRSFVTYSVDASDPKILTFHSNFIVPSTPKNIVFLDDDKTALCIITEASTYIYGFNASTGWTLVKEYPYKFSTVGRDKFNRVWAVDNSVLNIGRVHLLESNTLPVSVTVTPANNDAFNYSGSPITSSVLVNAYDSSNTRMQANVTLTVAGGSLRLLNNSNTEVNSYMITTSSSSDTEVGIKIIASGTSTISTFINI